MKLKIHVKNISACEKKLSIDVPEEVVTDEFNQFYEAISKRAKIPGFRPGHAPRNVVALHYKDAAKSEVLKELVFKSLQNAVETEEILLIGNPKVENVDFAETRLKFDALVEVRPKVKIDRYAGLEIKHEPLKVNDDELREAIQKLQDARGKFVVIENRPVQEGDFIICDYSLEVNGKSPEKKVGEWIELRREGFLKYFTEQLTGAQAGESRTVSVTFPKDYPQKEWADQPGKFLVQVKEIKEKKLPELNDEFAREVGEYQTLEELRTSIRKELEKNKHEENDSRLDEAIYDELIKRSKFDVPQGIVEDRLKHLLEDRIEMFKRYGMSEEAAKEEGEKLKKTLHSQAEREVRISFIVDEIGKRENLEVLEHDFEEQYRKISERFRRSMDEIKSYYEQDEHRKRSLHAQLDHQKVIRWVREKANIKAPKA